MGRKKRTIEQLAKELEIELPKPKCFKVADIRQLEKQVMQGEISYSRMVEIMNEMVDKFYNKKTSKMEKEELEQYQKLTKFQKDLADALINLGFKHKYFATYELIGWGNVKVDKFNSWSDVIKYVHEQGKDQKRFEFQRVLGI